MGGSSAYRLNTAQRRLGLIDVTPELTHAVEDLALRFGELDGALSPAFCPRNGRQQREQQAGNQPGQPARPASSVGMPA